MSVLRMAAAAAPFDRDVEGDFARIEKLVAEARSEGWDCWRCPRRRWAATW